MKVVGGDAQRAVRAHAIRGAIDGVDRASRDRRHPSGWDAALFAAAKAAGDPKLVVAAGPGDPTAAATLDPDARAHLADTLAVHQVAIVTQRPVALNGTRERLVGVRPGRRRSGRPDGGRRRASEVEYVLARPTTTHVIRG